MLMSKANRRAIYEYLFKEGVAIAKKELTYKKHEQINVPNIHVIKAIQSLVSRNFVKEQYSWGYYYWFLKAEGVEFLREALHLPPEIVPETYKRPPPSSKSVDEKFQFKSGIRGFGRDGDDKQFTKDETIGNQEMSFASGNWRADQAERRQQLQQAPQL